ncbi:hypothetical protein BJX65DRAFT_7756 [Aspergillus insuetus]
MDNEPGSLPDQTRRKKATVTPGRRLDIEKSDTTPPKTRSDTAQLATGDGTERQVEHQWMMERSWPSRTLGGGQKLDHDVTPAVRSLLPRLSRRFHRGLDSLAHPPSRRRGVKLRQGLPKIRQKLVSTCARVRQLRTNELCEPPCSSNTLRPDRITHSIFERMGENLSMLRHKTCRSHVLEIMATRTRFSSTSGIQRDRASIPHGKLIGEKQE